MNRVFIHIGLPKTATSSIQSFLYDNTAFLNQHGYHYLQTGLNHQLKCHHDMIWKLGLHKGPSYVEENINEFRQETLDSLAAEVDNNPDKDLILSSELLTFIGDFSKLQPVLDIFKDKEVRYILNLRRQDKFLESLYQQVVKDGVGETFEMWFHKSRSIGNYNALLTRLLQITIKEFVTVDVFDGRIPHLHPMENFMCSLGFDRAYLKGFEIENIKENESLSRKQIDKLQASNLLNPNLRFDLLREFAEENSRSDVEKAQYLDDAWRNKIIESFEISNLKLIETMGLSSDKSKYLLQ